jgi:recombination protein RecA
VDKVVYLNNENNIVMAKSETKKQTSDDVMKELNSLYGKNTLMKLDDDYENDAQPISTGSLGLDRATGIGGVPRGRLIEMVGPESTGKTTIATHILANAQKMGKVAIIDKEQTYDFRYAQKLGLDKKEVFFTQPEYGEQSFEIMKRLLDTGEFAAILLDSVAANIPKEQYEGETGQSRMARLAALMSLELPKISPKASRSNCLVIFNNQYRMNIGGYGNPEKAAGGDSLKYYASMRLDIRKSAELEEHRNKTKVKIIKNKCAMPYGTCEFYIDWGLGINRTAEILDMAIEQSLINVSGSWYSYNGSKVQGESAMITLLNDNEEYYKELMSKISL